MKLLSAEEVKNFSKYEEFKAFNSMQEESYSWIEFETTESTYVPLENMPICIPAIRDELGMSEEVSNETIAQQMEDTKLALSYPGNDKRACYPVGPTAFRGTLERIGATCSAMTSLKDTRRMNEVNPVDKATICNTLSKYTKGKSLLLVGDELILADLSTDYVVLPFGELLDVTEEELYESFEYVKFVNGNISHESSIAEFMFVDSEIDNNLLDSFANIGMDVSDYNAHILIMSSNVGLSGANLYPIIRSQKNGHTLSIGTPIKLEHKGTANMEIFRKNLRSCFASFKDISDHLEAMKSVRIANPADCFYNIAHALQLPEKPLRETYENFDSEYPFSCNGTEIYRRLFEVYDIYVSDPEEKVSDLRAMQIQENITRICFHNISKYDMPVVK